MHLTLFFSAYEQLVVRSMRVFDDTDFQQAVEYSNGKSLKGKKQVAKLLTLTSYN